MFTVLAENEKRTTELLGDVCTMGDENKEDRKWVVSLQITINVWSDDFGPYDTYKYI